jgi:hypothetical protein
MSLPPLPQFKNEYEGQKLRYLVQVLETSFNDFANIQSKFNKTSTVMTYSMTAGNISTGETTLFTAPISISTIKSTNWQIYIQTYGTFASTINTKELKLYLNNVVIYDSTAVAANGGSWNIDAVISWNGIALQNNMVTTNSSNPTFPSTAVYSQTTASFSAPIIVKLTGTGGATNDIIAKQFIVTIQPN